MRNTMRTLNIIVVLVVLSGVLVACAGGNRRRLPTVTAPADLGATTAPVTEPTRMDATPQPVIELPTAIQSPPANEVSAPTSEPTIAAVVPDTMGDNLEYQLNQLNAANQSADGLEDVE